MGQFEEVQRSWVQQGRIDNQEKDYTSIHLAFKFHLRDGSVDEVLPKLPKKPDDVWHKDKLHPEDGFSYKLELHGCRLLDEKVLHPFLEEIEKLYPQLYEQLPDETTSEFSIAVYVKDSSGVHIDWDSIASIEALGASVDIDIYSVR